MTGETVPSGREKCRLWILRHINEIRYVQHITKSRKHVQRIEQQDIDLKRVRRGTRLSLRIVITAWIFQSIQLIDDARTITMNIWLDVLFPYVKPGAGENDPPEEKIFIDPFAKRKNRRNRFQHIWADKRYWRSGAKAQWAPDGFEIKTICKLGIRINRRVQPTRRQRDQLLCTNRWINSVRLVVQSEFIAKWMNGIEYARLNELGSLKIVVFWVYLIGCKFHWIFYLCTTLLDTWDLIGESM